MTRFNGAATFQPRNVVHLNDVGSGDFASMGPRLFSRGMAASWSIRSRQCWLQWGRDFSAAECRRSCHRWAWWMSFNGAATFKPRNVIKKNMLVADLIRLQWGRDFSAAEWSNQRTHRPPRQGFNGAATFQPRNVALFTPI